MKHFFLQKHKVDIVCLQEAGRPKAQNLFSEMGSYFNLKGLAYRGSCAILSKYPLEQKDWYEKNYI